MARQDKGAVIASKVALPLIDVTPIGNNRYVARYHYFDAPTPFTVIKRFKRHGADVLLWSVDGQQQVVSIKYEVTT